MNVREELLERLNWTLDEASECELIGAHRLAGWWRSEARRLEIEHIHLLEVHA